MNLEKIPKQETSQIEQEQSTVEGSVVKLIKSPEEELLDINNSLQIENSKISETTEEVNKIRHSLGLTGEDTDIPSISLNKKKVEELEQKLKQVLESDVSIKYKDAIEEVRKSKIDWANSPELVRRLKLRGADEQDLINIKNWLVNNATEAKTVILPPAKFKELVDTLHEMTGEENIQEAKGFHVPGGREDVPEYVKNSIVMMEKPMPPPVPGREIRNEDRIDNTTLHHEFGHVTQSGLLESNAYENWKPKLKENAPNPEYISDIKETDTRIRSMYRDLNGLFDPEKEVFGRKHLEILQEKLKQGKLNQDTKDLLEHYDSVELVKLANRMPAI